MLIEKPVQVSNKFVCHQVYTKTAAGWSGTQNAAKARIRTKNELYLTKPVIW